MPPDGTPKETKATLPAPVKKWVYPFQGTDKTKPDVSKAVEVVDPKTYFDALARAEDGFYPIGVNGLWHGGIHFGSGTGGTLSQDSGVRCIADGEVIAYRIDGKYPTVKYNTCGEATYSTGFVLVKHRLQLPPAPKNASQTGGVTPTPNPNAVTPTPTPDVVTPTPVTSAASAKPEEPSLVFFSLYMHLLDWAGFEADKKRLRPEYWDGEKQYEVGTKAKDKEEALAKGQVGERVRDDDHKVIALLPQGAKLTLGAESAKKKGYFAIASVVSGDTTPAGQHSGYVFKAELDAICVLKTKDAVVVLDKPEPIKAGALIGYLGEYQRSIDTHPLAQACAGRPLLQVEVFSGDDVPAFLTKSKARGAALDARQKTLLEVKEGAKLVFPTKDDQQIAAGEDVKVEADSPKAGAWAKVKKLTATPAPTKKNPNATELAASGEALWIEHTQLNSNGQRASTTLPAKAWSVFPLQTKDATGPTAAWPRVVAIKLLKTTASEADGTRWWQVDVAQADGGNRTGWARESGHDQVALRSPWEWPGFELVEEDSTTPADQYAKKVDETNQATPAEQADFKVRGERVKEGPLFQKLYDVIDLDKDKVLSIDELRKALQKPALAQTISRLITRYESEWGGGMSKWDEIDKDIPEPRRADWVAEKSRIQKLQWWNQLKGKHGFPDSPVAYHFHPVGLVANFWRRSVLTLEMLQKVFPSGDTSRLQSIVDEINPMMEEYKLDTSLRLTHFFAQVREETGTTCKFVENDFTYSPERLKSIFSYFSNHPDEATLYGKTEDHDADFEAIANRAYGSRNGNGDVASGDGWRYRGRGLKQLTGKSNYQDFIDNYNKAWDDGAPDVINNPEILEQPKYAVRSGVFFWLHYKLYEIADTGTDSETVDKITKIINKHTGSYAERQRHFSSAWEKKAFHEIGE